MVLPEGFLQISNRVRNWGRWGDDDQLGTLNFITPELIFFTAELNCFYNRISLLRSLTSLLRSLMSLLRS